MKDIISLLQPHLRAETLKKRRLKDEIRGQLRQYCADKPFVPFFTRTAELPLPSGYQNGVFASWDDLLLGAHSSPLDNRVDVLKTIDDATPIFTYLISAIEKLEKSRKRSSHLVRSSIVMDAVLCIVNPTQRSRMRYDVKHGYGSEKNEIGSYFDQTKQRTWQGPDFDFIIEFDTDTFFKEFVMEIQSCWQQTHWQQNDLEHVLTTKNETEEVHLWKVGQTFLGGTKIQPRYPHIKHEWHTLYVRAKKTRTRSGINIIDIDVCVSPTLGYQLHENTINQLDVVFAIGITPFYSLPEELQKRDSRHGQNASSWDNATASVKAHPSLSRAAQDQQILPSAAPSLYEVVSQRKEEIAKHLLHIYGIEVPKSSISDLTRPLEAPSAILDFQPIAFFERAIRDIRYAIMGQDMLMLSEEGQAHLQRSLTESNGRYSLALSERTTHIYKTRLTDPEYRRVFASEFAKLTLKQKEYITIKIASEIETMIYYGGRDALYIINDLGLREFFPYIRDIPIDQWEEILQQIPTNTEVENLFIMNAQAGRPSLDHLRGTYPDKQIEEAYSEVVTEETDFYALAANAFRQSEFMSLIIDAWEKVFLNQHPGSKTSRKILNALFCLDPWTMYKPTRQYNRKTHVHDDPVSALLSIDQFI